jgi:hypothetical protein
MWLPIASSDVELWLNCGALPHFSGPYMDQSYHIKKMVLKIGAAALATLQD